MAVDIGVGLWTFQSTAHHPRALSAQYREFPALARRVERLGYSSLWLGEHRFWYDAWCPAPLMPIAAAATATSTLRLGTAVSLLPQHDPERLRQVVDASRRLLGDRLELGVGLGHRDAEFDGLGIPRPRRGRRMDAGLDVLARELRVVPPQRVWVGGLAPAALRRLGRRGLSSLLPQTLDTDALRRAVATIESAAADAGVRRGRLGVLKDVWIDTDGARARDWFLPRLRRHYVEEAGAWWVLKGECHGFGRPRELEKQVDRVVDSAIVGSPDEVAAQLSALGDHGIDQVVARLHFDFVPPEALDGALASLARTVFPEVAR